MAIVHLVEGPVGAGKSTYAFALSRQHTAPRFILDDWMARLFRPDRPETDLWPWYAERKARCIDQIWEVASDCLDLGQDVVLELGLVTSAARAEFYARADTEARTLRIHLLDVSRDVRRERVKQRNAEQGATYAMHVDDEVFELASDLWEPPDDAEITDRAIEFPIT